MEASPTLRQPLRLSCLRKPPQRFEMFSTTRPWEGERERERVIWVEPQDRGSAVTSHSAPKPTDPALSLGLDNATQQAHTFAHTFAHPCSTHRRAHKILSTLLSSCPSLLWKHTPHLYVRLEVEQVDLLPVAAIEGQDIPRLREWQTGCGQRQTSGSDRGGRKMTLSSWSLYVAELLLYNTLWRCTLGTLRVLLSWQSKCSGGRFHFFHQGFWN